MTNPYEAPGFDDATPPPPAEARPAAVTVFGVLNIIYGAIGLLCNPINAMGNLVPAQQVRGGPFAGNPIFELALQPGFRAGSAAFHALSAFACGALLASGVGLLSGKGWGRRLGIGYALLDVAIHLGNMGLVAYFIAAPLVEQARQANDPAAGGNAIGGIGGMAVVLGLGLVYPTLLLIFMTRPGVARALGAGRPAGPEALDVY